MAKQTFSFTIDDQLHRDIYEIVLSKESGERSAYIRSCIEFYEANKDKEVWTSDKVLELVKEIKARFVGGIPAVYPDDPGNEQDEMFEDMLKQFD